VTTVIVDGVTIVAASVDGTVRTQHMQTLPPTFSTCAATQEDESTLSGAVGPDNDVPLIEGRVGYADPNVRHQSRSAHHGRLAPSHHVAVPLQ
jgi:hypothetical protein